MVVGVAVPEHLGAEIAAIPMGSLVELAVVGSDQFGLALASIERVRDPAAVVESPDARIPDGDDLADIATRHALSQQGIGEDPLVSAASEANEAAVTQSDDSGAASVLSTADVDNAAANEGPNWRISPKLRPKRCYLNLMIRTKPQARHHAAAEEVIIPQQVLNQEHI